MADPLVEPTIGTGNMVIYYESGEDSSSRGAIGTVTMETTWYTGNPLSGCTKKKNNTDTIILKYKFVTIASVVVFSL